MEYANPFHIFPATFTICAIAIGVISLPITVWAAVTPKARVYSSWWEVAGACLHWVLVLIVMIVASSDTMVVVGVDPKYTSFGPSVLVVSARWGDFQSWWVLGLVAVDVLVVWWLAATSLRGCHPVLWPFVVIGKLLLGPMMAVGCVLAISDASSKVKSGHFVGAGIAAGLAGLCACAVSGLVNGPRVEGSLPDYL